MSYLRSLECPECGAAYPPQEVQHLCACGSPLLARYDTDAIAARTRREDLAGRPPTLWRYREFLPLADPAARVSLGEGMTPCLEARRLGAALGLRDLWLKDEGTLPTGTFKARGAAVGVSRARELGVTDVAMPTAGNAGGAWALYAARAGLRAHIAMPSDAPAVNRLEVSLAGADLRLVDGLISDAGTLIAREGQARGWYDAATLREPYRLEGKKTIGLELAEQFRWEVPDVIVCPTGGGVGLIGIWKALDELEAAGWLGGRRPRLVAVQAEGCQPIVRAFQAGAARSDFFSGARTMAAGLRVPKALGDFLVLRAIRETGGTAVAVSEEAILEGVGLLARLEGILACPEGAAAVAGCMRLRDEGWLAPSDRVVVLNTGSGLKYPEAMAAALRA